MIRITGPNAVRTVLLAGAVLVSVTASAAVFVDDAGRSVSVTEPIHRLVTLAPSLAELVYAVDAGTSMVGTVSRSDYPAAARDLPRIGDFQRFDVERILMLKPDLVLAWNHGNPSRELAQLEDAGLRLFYLEPKRLDEIPRALERLGALLGHEAAGRSRAEALRREIEALRAAHAAAAPVSVFYQVWSQPLMTLNGRQIVSDAIAACGGRNVFADLPQLVAQVSTEAVLAADPEVILTASDEPGDAAGLVRDGAGAAFAPWQRHRGLTAVRRRWLYSVPGDWIARQGPRIVQGTRAVCAALDQVRAERGRRP